MVSISNEELSMMGKRWLKLEDEQLLNEINDKLDISDISKIHKRTIGAVRSRILQHSYNLINNNDKTIEEISEYMKTSIEELKKEFDIIKYKLKLKLKKEEEIVPDQTEVLQTEVFQTEIINTEDIKVTMYNKIIDSLNEKQKEVIKCVDDYNNVFLTGSPGTGKSYTLMKIIELLRFKNKNYGITALTGCAAVLINAQTVHSFLGIGLGKDSISNIIFKLKNRNKPKYQKLYDLQTLVIDEISMMDDTLFEKISELFCKIKDNKRPFGGLQLILVGDFCQLPPINGNYCFTSSIWSKINLKSIELIEIVRQKGDIEFQNILQEIRTGKCSKKTFNKLLELRETKFENGIIPTRLYPISVDVDNINTMKFNNLCKKEKSTIWLYKSVSYNKNIKQELYDISLIKNTQIMITRNIDIDNGLLNGTRGIVDELYDNYIIIKDVNNKLHKIEYYTDLDENMCKLINFIPVKLAYALSIHKSQGMTIDALAIDLGCNIFIAGQLYTALSRAKTLNSIKIIDLHQESFITHPLVKNFYNL